MFNTEEEDESAMGAVRYPCLPSLVALQQMRNRLHLAYLGRKLMKWTALATGRELRKMSMNIDKAYASFGDDLKNAFMLLARARYFYPNLNKMVIENVPEEASVVVTTTHKAIAGVKVLSYGIIESGVEPYEHLGIEKGGQIIHEAKIAWLELLKHMILILELRLNFTLVETAHRNATKRQVMNKMAIPRTQSTMLYIIELEELAREEMFRIKIIKKKKTPLGEETEDSVEIGLSPICDEHIGTEYSIPIKNKSMQGIARNEHEHKIEPLKSKDVLEIPKTMIDNALSQKVNILNVQAVIEPDFTNKTDEHVEKTSLEYLMALLSNIIKLCKSVIETKDNVVENRSYFNDFLKMSESAKKWIDNFIEAKTTEIDAHLKEHLKNLRFHLERLTDQEFQNDTLRCEDSEYLVDSYRFSDDHGESNNNEPEMIVKDTKTDLTLLKQQTNQIIPNVNGKHISLSTPSANNLANTKKVKKSIDSGEKNDLTDQKSRLGRLLTSKTSLNEHKKEVILPQKVMDPIKQTIDLSLLPKKVGLTDENVDDFVNCCVNIKQLVEIKGKKGNQTPETLVALQTNISGIIKMLNTREGEDSVTKSVENIMNICVETKNSIDVYKMHPPTAPVCNDECDKIDNCDLCKDNLLNKESILHKENKCVECEHESKKSLILAPINAPEPCNTCRSIAKVDEPEFPPCSICTKSKPIVCDLCKLNIDAKEDLKTQTPKTSPSFTESKKFPISTVKPDSQADINLGYFEKKVKTIKRLTRTLNDDGTIREETEIIIVTKSKHDPLLSLMDVNDQNVGKEIDGVCTNEDKTVDVKPNPGFDIKTVSEDNHNSTSVCLPNVRQCVSFDMRQSNGERSNITFEFVISSKSLNSIQKCDCTEK